MKKDLRISELNDIYGELLTSRQREILQNYYDYDLSLSEIAENMGISRQGARDAIVKASEQLSFYEEVVGYADKKQRTESCVADALGFLERGDIESAKSVLDGLLKSIQE